MDHSSLPAEFNFAQFLIDANAARPDKLAYVDDDAKLTYGELTDQIRRAAAGLQALGLRREDRVLLLMHDCSDWPVCFLGAIYAGIVPVAVNTLLTPDDYAYMLRHSRARAALVSAALLPVLEQAMAKATAEGGHELDHVIVSHAEGALPAGTGALDALIAGHAPQPSAAATGPDDPGFWLYSSGSTGRPKGVLHSQANPYWTAELYAKPILGLTEHD